MKVKETARLEVPREVYQLAQVGHTLRSLPQPEHHRLVAGGFKSVLDHRHDRAAPAEVMQLVQDPPGRANLLTFCQQPREIGTNCGKDGCKWASWRRCGGFPGFPMESNFG